jgi:tetratricopeptide (TPR) repeat protein
VAYADRGEVHRLLGDHDRALRDCNRAVGLDPRLAWAYVVRGSVHAGRGAYARAAGDWRKALELAPDHDETLNALAWLLATCPDHGTRDGRQAVRHATQACELSRWADADYLATLAAAHAECGQFAQAVDAQRRALALAGPAEQERFQALLALYQTHRPHREP